MLYQSAGERTPKNNLRLAASTAFIAGATNVAGAMACFSFTANVSGHAAAFAKHLVSSRWFELAIIFLWLLLFFLGAFTAHFLIRSFEHKGPYKAHALPLVLEMCLLYLAGGLGLYFEASSPEWLTQLLTGLLLFAMGLQNSTVSFISGGGIKTSHLTGLFTDLGAEISEWVHPRSVRTSGLKAKIQLRLHILLFYLLGGIAGGGLFIFAGMSGFFVLGIGVALIICYDYFAMRGKLFPEKKT